MYISYLNFKYRKLYFQNENLFNMAYNGSLILTDDHKSDINQSRVSISNMFQLCYLVALLL